MNSQFTYKSPYSHYRSLTKHEFLKFISHLPDTMRIDMDYKLTVRNPGSIKEPDILDVHIKIY